MNIGDRVRVTTRYKESYIHATSPYRDTVLEGTVVKSGRLDPEGTFNLLTGNPNYPISTIAYKNVIASEVIGHVKGSPKSNGTKYVIVISKKGNEHRVALHSSGTIECDCDGFSYRKRCSHSADTKAWLEKKYGSNWKLEIFK